MEKITKTEDFIRRAKQIHGEKYDYSSTIFKNKTSPIKIVCSSHGEYFQHPIKHLSGQGCPVCSRTTILKSNEKTKITNFKQTKDEIINMVNLVLKEKEQVGFDLTDWNFHTLTYMGDNFTEAYCKFVLDIFNQKFGELTKKTIETFGDTLQTSIEKFPKSYQKQKSSIKTIFEGCLFFHTNMNIDNMKIMVIKLAESLHLKVIFKEKESHNMTEEQVKNLKNNQQQ